jgi:hypothetical protein
MEREDVIKFTNSVVLLSKLLIITEDRFLKQKLHGKVSDFVSTFVEWNPKNVAQCRNKDLLNSVNNLLDYLEYLAHISKSNVTPLFLAQRNLLKFKLHILKQSKETKDTTSDVVNSAILISKPSVRTKSVQLAPKLNLNKERILNYIKKTPDVRTKDVMSEFSALSGRTIKRSLKELTDKGFLKKRSDGAAVYYTCG